MARVDKTLSKKSKVEELALPHINTCYRVIITEKTCSHTDILIDR